MFLRLPRVARAGLAMLLVVAAGPSWAATPLAAEGAPPAASASASAPTSAPTPGPRVWLAGPAGAALPLADALRQAADGDVIELMPGRYTERLVINQRRLTLRGLRGGEAVQVLGDALKPMAEHALWTVRGGDVTLEEITFRGARASDGSGAALRQEGGKLTIRRCRFFDNEHGLVALNDPQAEVTVEASLFGMAPRVEGGLHHLVSIGRIGKFSVSGTRFQQGFEGHLLKTRARENLITYNFIHDGQRGGASLEIDIAHGGLATVVGNVIGQGSESQNPVLLSYGSEDSAWTEHRLVLVHNTFINHGWTPAWFLRVHRGRLPAPVEVVALNNLLVGGGLFEWVNEGLFIGNTHARRGELADVDTQAFELPPASRLRGSAADPRSATGRDFAPRAEFDFALGSKPLDPPPAQRQRWAPGAFQK